MRQNFPATEDTNGTLPHEPEGLDPFRLCVVLYKRIVSQFACKSQ